MSENRTALLSSNLRYSGVLLLLLAAPVVVAIFVSYGTYEGSCAGQSTEEGYTCSFGQHLSSHMFPYDVFSWVLIAWTLAIWIQRVSSKKLTATSLPGFISWMFAMLLGGIALLLGFISASSIHTRLLPSILDILY